MYNECNWLPTWSEKPSIKTKEKASKTGGEVNHTTHSTQETSGSTVNIKLRSPTMAGTVRSYLDGADVMSSGRALHTQTDKLTGVHNVVSAISRGWFRSKYQWDEVLWRAQLSTSSQLSCIYIYFFKVSRNNINVTDSFPERISNAAISSFTHKPSQ